MITRHCSHRSVMCKTLLIQPLASSLTLSFSVFYFIFICGDFALLKPSWNKGLSHRLPGRPAPGVVRSILFLLIDHKPAKHKDSACQPNLKKKKKKNNLRKNTEKKKRKNVKTLCSLLSLIGLGINSLQIQSTETVSRGLMISSHWSVNETHRTRRRSFSLRWKRNDDPLPVADWGEAELNPILTVKCHHSDLVWLFDYLWLFHCGWVSLLVQWQWSSVCLMFISFLYFLTYFAVSWN